MWAPKQKKVLKQLREAVDDQRQNWEGFLKLASEHYKHHESISEEILKKPPSPEEEEYVAHMVQAWNRPWVMWEEQALKRFEMEAKNRERQAGIVSTNAERQQKAAAAHQLYREIAEKLIAENPMLGRATQDRLAQRVQAELIKQGRRSVSTRTIKRALKQ